MSRIVPLTPSKHAHHRNNPSKPHPNYDWPSNESSCYSSTSKVSASQSLSSSHRLNELKPKLKISVSRSSTLNSNGAKL